MLNIGFIGAGTTGTALASRLDQQGFMIRAVSSRSLSSAQRLAGRVENCKIYKTAQEVADNSQVVFITTPDDVIRSIAESVSWHENSRSGQIFNCRLSWLAVGCHFCARLQSGLLLLP